MSDQEHAGLLKVLDYIEKPPAQLWFPGLKRSSVTDEHRKELYRRQAGLCALCCRQSDPQNVDHDHDSGLVRGLLCIRCNTRILGNLTRLGEPSKQPFPAGRSDTHPPTWLVEVRQELTQR